MAYHICLFSAHFLPSIGGVEKYTDNLARTLAEQGHRVTIVTNNTFGLTEHECLTNNVEIYRLPCIPLFNGRLPLPKRAGRFKTLLKELESNIFDFVSINTRFYPHTFIGVRLAEKQGIRPVVIDHGSAYLTFGSSLIDKVVVIYERAITALLKRHSIDFYGVSQASSDWLKTFGIRSKGVLSNAINAQKFRQSASSRNFRAELRIPGSSPVVSFTGRLIPEKGVDKLCAAAALIEQSAHPIHVLIAGAGPLERELRKSLPSNAHLLGKLSSPDIAALLAQSDAFCMPTRSEGFSTSLLEASACGTPAIITNVGGVAEMIPDDTYGVVLPSTEPRAIAQAITTLCNDPDARNAIAHNIRNRTETEFSWQTTATKVLKACQEANGSR